MRFQWIWGAIAIGISTVALAQPATQPATRRATSGPSTVLGTDLGLEAQVLRLWPNDPPATQPFDDTDKVNGYRSANRAFLSYVQFPSLMVFPAKTNGPTPAVIICPGGGYGGQAISHEGIAIAQRFNEAGVTAFVLRYRLPKGQPPAANELPVPQQDVLRAVQLVRTRAAEFNIDPKKVGVAGFSAGGHLAATAATMYDQANLIPEKDAIAQTPARPDFAILVYPVIRMDRPVTNAGTRKNLLGEDATPELEARFDPSRHVTADTPPIWIVQAVDDKTVPQANAMAMIEAANQAKIPHALLLISHGGHGFGLGTNPEAQAWFDTCLGWLRGQKILN